MSVINQVLSDLEKRGVNALPGESSVRAVPAQRSWLKPALLVAAMLVLALVLAMQWRSSAQPRLPAPVAKGVLHGSSADNELAASATSAASATAMPVAPLRAESQRAESHPVVAVAAQETRREESRQQDGAAAAAVPAMRMSFELSAIPLPSSLRAQPPASAATGQHSTSGAAPPTPAKPDGGGAKAAHPQQRNAAAPAETRLPVTAPSVAAPPGGVDKQIKQLSVQQQADNEFRKASGLLQQGRTGEALAGCESALRLDPGHDAARQALVGLLLESKRGADAERVLQDGLEHNPKHGAFAMLLARLQVERDAVQPALDTLLKTLPYVGQQADYHAFAAALLQRLNRHQEAVAHYRTALQQAPGSGIWLMGLGISLQALQRIEEAREAFRHALESRVLNPELQAFVRQRLKEL